MCFLHIGFEHKTDLMLTFCQTTRHIKQNICTELSPTPRRCHGDAVALTPCHLQLHRNRCHSLSPPLTSNTGGSQQPLDNWSSSWRSPQREKGKTDTAERTFNLCEPTETEPGVGEARRGRGGTRQRGELWGTEIPLMSWVVLANVGRGGWFV